MGFYETINRLDHGISVENMYTNPFTLTRSSFDINLEVQTLDVAKAQMPYQSGEKPIEYGVTDVYRLENYGEKDAIDNAPFQIEICRRVSQGENDKPIVHYNDSYALIYLNNKEGKNASAINAVLIGSPEYRLYKMNCIKENFEAEGNSAHNDKSIELEVTGYVEGTAREIIQEKGIKLDERAETFLCEKLAGYTSDQTLCGWDKKVTTVLDSISYPIGEREDTDPIIIERYAAKINVGGENSPFFNIYYRNNNGMITSDYGSGKWYAERHQRKMKRVESYDDQLEILKAELLEKGNENAKAENCT